MAVFEMDSLLGEINALISAPSVDRVELERTLTDGYAQALSLETERTRLDKRVAAVMQESDSAEKAKELTRLAKRLAANAGELSELRAALAQLKRRG